MAFGKAGALVLDAPQDQQVLTNAELARSVIWNLLRNACQYTEEGEVRVELRSATLRIADTGPGLPPSTMRSSSSVSCPALGRVVKAWACPSCSVRSSIWAGR